MYAFLLAFWVAMLIQFRGRTQSPVVVPFAEQTTRQHNTFNAVRDVYFVLV